MCISSSSSICSFRSCQAAPVSPRRIQECTLGKHLKQGGAACSLQHLLHYSQKLCGTFCTSHVPEPRSWAEPSPQSPGTQHSRVHEEMQNSPLQQGSTFRKGNEALRILGDAGLMQGHTEQRVKAPSHGGAHAHSGNTELLPGCDSLQSHAQLGFSSPPTALRLKICSDSHSLLSICLKQSHCLLTCVTLLQSPPGTGTGRDAGRSSAPHSLIHSSFPPTPFFPTAPYGCSSQLCVLSSLHGDQ